MIKKIAILMCVVLGGLAQNKTIIDKVAAKVDNYIVLKSEVEQMAFRSTQQGQPVSECQALQSIVVQKMMVAKAEIDSVKLEDKEIDNALGSRMEMMAQQFGSEKNIVEAYGKSIETLKSELRGQVREQLLAQKMQGEIQNNIKITPNEVKKFFNAIPKDSLPYISEEAEISHIVKIATVTKALKDELKARLLEYKKRILAGEDFGTLAKEYTEDPGSKPNGGLYLNTKRGVFAPEYEAAVFKLKQGEMSDIVETEFGFHLIKLEEMKGQEFSSRHILLRPEYSRLDVSSAKKLLDSVRNLIKIDSISFQKAAKIYSDDKQNQDSGGEILNAQDGSNRHPLDVSMDSYLYLMLNDMKEGDISLPQDYRTEDGKTGMRIVKLVKKHPGHTANYKDDYLKLSNIALENKKAVEMDNWFAKAVKDVFIKIESEYQGCQLYGVNTN